MNITKYGDVGTPERHKKFGGVDIKLVEGQPCTNANSESIIDELRRVNIFNDEQYNAVYRLIRDYQTGILYKWGVVRNYLRTSGMSVEEAEEEREAARKQYNAARKYNNDFGMLSDLAHITLSSVGVYIPSPQRLSTISDKLVRYYNDIAHKG